MIIVQESYEKFYNERLDILEKHYNEVEYPRSGGSIKAAEGFYEDADLNGDLHIFVAYEGEDFLGYIIFLETLNYHDMDTSIARSDLLYVVPDKRNSGVAIEMISFAEEYFKELGVECITLGVPKEMNFIEDLGYNKGQVTYYKRLS